MSSTNKTQHYELSQFLGTDKPAWLGDYNSDMQKIDTGINQAQTTATGADGKADTANTAIGDLTNLQTTNKTSVVSAVNEVKTNADTAQNTANTATSGVASNRQSINALKDYLTLSSETDLTATPSAGTTGLSELKIRKNNDGSLFKFYGRFTCYGIAGSGTLLVTTSDTGLRPSSPITITGSTLRFDVDNTTMRYSSYTINTNGTITFALTRTTSLNSVEFYFMSSLTFLEDFNDPVIV